MAARATVRDDNQQAARAAALRHVGDHVPGISRVRAGAGFTYRTPAGKRVTSQSTLARIRALAIPPAWTSVWICPNAHGHLQATGRDARGRKQYRYHTEWRRVRDASKYSSLSSFARALPRIRRRVQKDLKRTGLPREKVLAIIVRLMETTYIRIGNAEYARTNGSFGLTTMRDRHVQSESGDVVLRFRGKSGKSHSVRIEDPRLARLVKRCRDVPGYQLFQYVDDAGVSHRIDSADVNDYLREISGTDFTAKDFRTWGGTLLAATQIKESPANARVAKSNEVAAVQFVAATLGNTVAVCRKSYVHPAVLEAFLDDDVHHIWRTSVGRPAAVRGLRIDERRLLRFLDRMRAT